MIYDIDGAQLPAAYEYAGTELEEAYDIDKNIVYTKSTPLVVMSYNVGQWYIGNTSNVPTSKYSDYYTLQRSIISAYNPDVVGFQEYYDPFSSGHSVSSVIGEYFTAHKNNATSGYLAKAVYTNGYNISNYSYVNFVTGTRGYIKCSITVAGKTIWIINAHVETSSREAEKVAQSREVFEAVASLEYFIILADLNTVCKSVNDEEYTTIMKQFIDAGYHSANCSSQHGFIDTWTDSTTASGTWYACDHIITSANIDITDVTVDLQKTTSGFGDVIDHIPIIARLEIH